jgi:hypothetical protein
MGEGRIERSTETADSDSETQASGDSSLASKDGGRTASEMGKSQESTWFFG